GVEICEDSWVSAPPSCDLAKGGATVIANLSASDELIGKARYRRDLAKIHSSKTVSAFIYSSAGSGESTTDLVFSGHNLICENGLLLAESKPFEETTIYADIDLDKISFERARLNTFDIEENDYNEVYFTLPVKELNLIRKFSPLPFVPQNRENLTERCEEILSIQSTGLVTRLKHTNIKKAVLGISGGLDSTLALAVTVRAFDKLGLPRKNIIAVTMPAFGTTQRTKSNAKEIIGSYGCTYLEIDISETVKKHLKDINHDENTHDITYENAQARERTQVLMDIANKYNALVIGTGDLSELALGWATYNGDHMSMYGVNCSIPKTLVRHLVSYEAQRAQGNLKKALLDILDTPVSPELLPPKDGEISQKTEEVVGPYELHDFFLYYFIRFGYPPKKIYRIAKTAFSGAYDDETIKKWLKVFFTRFFQNQFKRSCLPDGPKVGTVSLSPRGDFRMPSDASCCAFLKEIEEL
ncbi:MAG: NAD(+) synthase, partial [Clostridiaceae bacterium]|nr:NAD(+) synthase [Clostridiaceae bacterium]